MGARFWLVGGSMMLLGASATAEAATWRTLVNTASVIPGSTEKFQSFSPPAVNGGTWGVFRGQDATGTINGVFGRTMNWINGRAGPMLVLEKSGQPVPQPNNTEAGIGDLSDFPRINPGGNTVLSVAYHQPVWSDGIQAQGQTSILRNSIKNTQASTAVGQFSALSAFPYWQVPDASAGTAFDRFVAPSPSTLNGLERMVFKGEYQDGGRWEGLYMRALTADGTSPVVKLFDSRTSLIPDGRNVPFGHFSPPSAGGPDTLSAVFLERPIDWTSTDNPGWGAIGKTHYKPGSYLFTYIKLGYVVPGVPGERFNRFGDTVSYNGRFISFWASWGTDFKPVKMVCPTEGDPATIATCNERHPGGDNTPVMQVPVNQGIFIYDVRPQQNRLVDRTNGPGDDYVFWTYRADSDTWEPSIQLAADSDANNLLDAKPRVAFKMRQGALDDTGVWVYHSDHLYLAPELEPKIDLLATGTTIGNELDPMAAGMTLTSFELERDSLRNKVLGIHARMRSETAEWAGIYVSQILP